MEGATHSKALAFQPVVPSICLLSSHGDLDKIEEQIGERGLSPNLQDQFGDAPLHWAARSGQLQAVKLLVLEFKATVDLPNFEGWTPLCMAVAHGHLAVADFLVRNGANLRWTTTAGLQAVHLACWYDNASSLQWLQQKGMDIHSQQEPLMISASDMVKPGGRVACMLAEASSKQ